MRRKTPKRAKSGKITQPLPSAGKLRNPYQAREKLRNPYQARKNKQLMPSAENSRVLGHNCCVGIALIG